MLAIITTRKAESGERCGEGDGPVSCGICELAELLSRLMSIPRSRRSVPRSLVDAADSSGQGGRDAQIVSFMSGAVEA